nr:hypothetical protein L204_00649 [Cryptococcus depauperatus CBS 7855]
MQLATLLPLLALLASSAFARSAAHPHAAAHRHQAIEREYIKAAAEGRDALHPRSSTEKLTRRKITRRGANCKVKDTTASTATASTVTSSFANAAAYQQPSNYVSFGTLESRMRNLTRVMQSSKAVTVTSTTAAATASTSAATTMNSGNLTPNNIKAGIAGGDAYNMVGNHVGWWYDWNPVPTGHTGSPIAVNMLWGAGAVDQKDAERLAAFKAITDTPTYIIGFEEPDCSTPGSSNIAVSDAAQLWDSTIAPWKRKGSILLSPSMCHQAAEQYTKWLTTFKTQISTPWDVTNLHINKNSMDGVKADIDYYYNTFGKPIWVTEFACVDDSSGFTPCTDQSEINQFINDIVDLFQSDNRVYAYAYSNGEGLSTQWMMVNNGVLTESGQTYITAIAKYH